jgi:hypothetical protein
MSAVIGMSRPFASDANMRKLTLSDISFASLSGYTNIIQPARKTERMIEMSKRFDSATVSSLICGEV